MTSGTTTPPVPPLTGTVTVAVGIEQAFEVFTSRFDTWSYATATTKTDTATRSTGVQR